MPITSIRIERKGVIEINGKCGTLANLHEFIMGRLSQHIAVAECMRDSMYQRSNSEHSLQSSRNKRSEDGKGYYVLIEQVLEMSVLFYSNKIHHIFPEYYFICSVCVGVCVCAGGGERGGGGGGWVGVEIGYVAGIAWSFFLCRIYLNILKV